MIRVEHLSKKYSNIIALEDLFLKVDPGEFYGLLGPNGAGKTTFMSLLGSLLIPTTGKIFINNIDISFQPTDFKKYIGFVPQEIALYNELTAKENLLFWGSLYQVPKTELTSKVNAILKWVGLSERKNQRIKFYSGGMKRRINLACALIHSPKILLLDEPTVGIDPQSRQLIFDLLQELNGKGMTIIYTTHYMEEVEKLCSKIGIIDKGKLIVEGSLAELKSQAKYKDLLVLGCPDLAPDKLEKFRSIWPDSLYADNQLFVYSSNNQQTITPFMQICQSLDVEIKHLELKSVNLETLFLHLTGKQLRD